MSAAQRLMALDSTKSIVPFGDGTNHQFKHSDLDYLNQPSGISVEEGEFLYGLIRLLRPVNVVEAGMNIGVSASYICLALQDNKRGHLTTIEHDSTVHQLGCEKLTSMGFKNYFGAIYGKVDTHIQNLGQYGDAAGHTFGNIDFLWIDTEFATRYSELLGYLPHLMAGAVACIHDLCDLDNEAYGGIPIQLTELLKSGELRALTFPTQHGVTVFQKRWKHDAIADIHKPKENHDL